MDRITIWELDEGLRTVDDGRPSWIEPSGVRSRKVLRYAPQREIASLRTGVGSILRATSARRLHGRALHGAV